MITGPIPYTDRRNILETVIQLCREGGATLKEQFRSGELQVSEKSRSDLVTNMDRAVEEYMVSALLKEFPEFGVIAEEDHTENASNRFIWYLDPLDGTNNYAHGIPFFSISIALFDRQDERTLLGAVYNVLFDEMYTAIQGHGAFCNNQQLSISATPSLDRALVASGFPYNRQDSATNNTASCAAMIPETRGFRRLGSAALDLSFVAAGYYDGYWERGLKAWDCAAGALLVEEAGGRVTSIDGVPFIPTSGECLATNGAIHDEMKEVLLKSK